MSSNFCHRTRLPRNFMDRDSAGPRVVCDLPQPQSSLSTDNHCFDRKAGLWNPPGAPADRLRPFERAGEHARHLQGTPSARLRFEYAYLLVELGSRLSEGIHRRVVAAGLLLVRETVLLRFEVETLQVRV